MAALAALALLIAGCVLLVIAVGGWRAYNWYEAKKAAEAGAAFEAAVVLAEQGKLSLGKPGGHGCHARRVSPQRGSPPGAESDRLAVSSLCALRPRTP